MKPVININDVKFDDVEENGLYTSSRGQISDHIGAKKLGYNLTVLPPGKAQCPFHCHFETEPTTLRDRLYRSQKLSRYLRTWNVAIRREVVGGHRPHCGRQDI
jgi:hypothetical protein